MATTENFIVSKTDKKIRRMHGNSYDYWRGEKRGTIDTEIEVFSNGNQQEVAKELYRALKVAGLENKYFSIKVQVK